MGDITEGSDKETHTHKDLNQCECSAKHVESVSYSLPDDSYISMTRCTSCKGLKDWKIRTHESKIDYSFGDENDEQSIEPDTQEKTEAESEKERGRISGFISFLERETIALAIVGLGVTIFAIQWGFTRTSGAIALLIILAILPLLYLTDRENN